MTQRHGRGPAPRSAQHHVLRLARPRRGPTRLTRRGSARIYPRTTHSGSGQTGFSKFDIEASASNPGYRPNRLTLQDERQVCAYHTI